MSWPAEIYPGDALISKTRKQVERRMLTVEDMLKIKTLSHQVTQTQKKTQIPGTSIQVVETPEAEQVKPNSVTAYMQGIHTYALAMAHVGTDELAQKVPIQEDFGVDSTLIVNIPLDVMMKYYFRALRFVQALEIFGMYAFELLRERDLAKELNGSIVCATPKFPLAR